jgi:hypothetical protein
MNNSLVIVDIQPAYETHHKHISAPLMEYINTSNYNKILWFFNGESEGQSPDTISDVQMYAYDHGLDEDKIDDIIFIDKYYSFFRHWMDAGVDEEFTLKVIRYMIKNDITDSESIDDFAMEMLIESYFDFPEGVDIREEFDYLWTDGIHIPHFKWEAIKTLGSVDTVGGGCNECLKEMEMLMTATGVSYNRLDQYTYG